MRLIHGEALATLRTLDDASVDAVVTDPPYPEIDRAYGRLTEAAWWDLMMGVCREVRRVLKPSGSAVFVLQPNSRKVGSMRGWLWRFLLWATEEWNVVQDAYWWNTSGLVLAGANKAGLMRPTVKACVWCGPADCYRDQSSCLWSESDDNRAARQSARLESMDCPSRRRSATEGLRDNAARMRRRAGERGGVTPFNLLPVGSDGRWSGGTHGHPASTPLALCRWWVRYLCPPGGTVLDPFGGSGTLALAALKEGRDAVLIEKEEAYVEIARRRIGVPA